MWKDMTANADTLRYDWAALGSTTCRETRYGPPSGHP